MIPTARILALAIALGLGSGAIASGAAPARAEGGIVAVANDKPITERDIEQRILLRKILGDLPVDGMTKPQALQNVVDDEVKIQEARRLQLLPTENEVYERIDKIAKSEKLDREQFLAKLKATGISEENLRRYVLASLAFSRIISVKYREDMTVTPEEVDARMVAFKNKVDAQMSKIMSDPRMKAVTVYSLLEISLPLDGEDPMLLQSRAIEAQQVLRNFKGCASARKAADGIFNVKIGKKFDADAAKLPKPMKQALDKAGQGRAVGPMRSKEGLQLIALCEVRKITPPKPDFKMPTREQIERLVINEKYDKLEEDYLKTARDKVYVEYRNSSYAQQ